MTYLWHKRGFVFVKANDSYLHFRDYNCESITTYRKRLQAPGIQGKTGISTYNNTRIRVVTVYSHLGDLCHINRYWNAEEETWLESQNPSHYKHTNSVPKKWTAITASKIVNVIINTIDSQLRISTAWVQHFLIGWKSAAKTSLLVTVQI